MRLTSKNTPLAPIPKDNLTDFIKQVPFRTQTSKQGCLVFAALHRKERVKMENIFEKGCLVQFSAGVWGASRKIKPEQLTDKNVSAQWLRASKKLIDPDAIKLVQKVVNATRSYLASASLPFPIHGMVFAPKEMISRLDEKLNEFKAEFFTTSR